MKRLVPACLTLLCLLIAVTLVAAQASSARILVSENSGDDTPFVQDEDFPIVQLDVIPVDEFGAPLAALDASQFILQEDGLFIENLAVQARTNPAQSISLLLLLDLSEPMQADLEILKTAVINFYQALSQGDESGLIAFGLPLADESNKNYELQFTNIVLLQYIFRIEYDSSCLGYLLRFTCALQIA